MEAEAPLLVAVTSLPGADGGVATAAAVGVALARSGAAREPLGVVVINAELESRQRPTLVSSAPARALEASLRTDLPAVARGTLCVVRPQRRPCRRRLR